MTYSEAFPLWVAEVYRNHGYEPGKWYGSEVAETLYNEAMATYNGPLAHPMPSRYSRPRCRRRSMPSVMFSCRLLGTMQAGTVRQRMLQRIL